MNFSVIVPTYDRPRSLYRCLAAISRMDYPLERCEVLVVDDGSRRSPAPVLAKFENHLNLRLLRQPNSGPASARNLGAAQAKGDFIAFTDDDCRPAKKWLHRLAQSLRKHPHAAVCGKTASIDTGNDFTAASQLIADYLFERYNRNLENASFAFGNNLAIGIEKYNRIGGFEPGFITGEDRAFCHRLRHMGLRLVYEPRAVVWHSHALTARTFFRQHYGYGKGSCRYRRKFLADGRFSLKLEGPSFYAGLIKYPLTVSGKPRAAWLTTLVLVSQFAIFTGYLAALFLDYRTAGRR